MSRKGVLEYDFVTVVVVIIGLTVGVLTLLGGAYGEGHEATCRRILAALATSQELQAEKTPAIAIAKAAGDCK